MKSVFAKPRKQNNLERNAFDLSSRKIFSAAPGQLLPVFVKEVNPNEHFEIKPQMFLRTQPLNTAAFIRAKQNIEFFFVPYRLLYSNFSKFITQVNNPTSSVLSGSVDNLNKLGFNLKTVIDYFNFSVTTSKLAGGSTASSTTAEDILFVEFHNGNIDVYGESPQLNALTDDKVDESGLPAMQGFVKLLDLLGYGNYHDRITGVGRFRLGTEPGNSGSFTVGGGHFGSEPRENSVVKKVVVSREPELVTTEEKKKKYLVNEDNKYLPFRFAAYQKIYNDFYLNKDLFAKDVVYNLDSLESSGNLFSNSPKCFELFKMRYRNRKKDLFQSIKPSPITNAFNTGLTSFVGNIDAQDLGEYYGLNVNSSPLYKDDLVNLYSSAQNIRIVFAMDKLARLTALANDQSYNAQIKAHYGFDPNLDSDSCVFIGAADAPIQINEVVATATSETTKLGNTMVGDIHGRGISMGNDGTISFDIREHGVIMGIYSIVPENDYQSDRIDYFNTAFNVGNYFIPEFDRLGEELLNTKEFNRKVNKTLGWVSRNIHYKTSIDEVHGAFNYGSLTAWASTIPNYIDRGLYRKGKQEVSDKTVYLNKQFFLIKPYCFNNVFSVYYNGSVDTDPFLCVLDTDVKAIRPMSVDGLPI